MPEIKLYQLLASFYHMFNCKIQEAVFFDDKCKNGILYHRCKGVNLQNCGTPLEFFTVENIIGSCLNTSESVIENLQAVWPQQHFKLGN